jgi:hypothetical protein
MLKRLVAATSATELRRRYIPEILVKLKRFTCNLSELLGRGSFDTSSVQIPTTIRLSSILDGSFLKVVGELHGVLLNENGVNLSLALRIEKAPLQLI